MSSKNSISLRISATITQISPSLREKNEKWLHTALAVATSIMYRALDDAGMVMEFKFGDKVTKKLNSARVEQLFQVCQEPQYCAAKGGIMKRIERYYAGYAYKSHKTVKLIQEAMSREYGLFDMEIVDRPRKGGLPSEVTTGKSWKITSICNLNIIDLVAFAVACDKELLSRGYVIETSGWSDGEKPLPAHKNYMAYMLYDLLTQLDAYEPEAEPEPEPELTCRDALEVFVPRTRRQKREAKLPLTQATAPVALALVTLPVRVVWDMTFNLPDLVRWFVEMAIAGAGKLPWLRLLQDSCVQIYSLLSG